MRRTLTETWFHDDAWWIIIDFNGRSTYTPRWSAWGITRLTLNLGLISWLVHVFVQDWIDIMWFQTGLYCRPAIVIIFFIVQKLIFIRTASFYKQFLDNIGSMSRTLLQSIWYVWGHLKIVVDKKGAFNVKNTRELRIMTSNNITILVRWHREHIKLPWARKWLKQATYFICFTICSNL